MLSRIESTLVRILRGTVVATASLAILTTVGALLYAGYAYFSPEPQANLYGRMKDFREATNPSNLISNIFPKNSGVVKDLASISDDVAYERIEASDQMIFDQMNKFLDVAFGARFQSEARFVDWFHGSHESKIPFSWNKEIDDENATNETNVNYLIRSLLFDYAKRLSVYGAVLAKARKQNLYSESFDQFTAPTGQANAPYFLVWFFNQLKSQLETVDAQLKQQQAQRDLLRLTAVPAIVVASSAFGYFIAVIFGFLFISLEASVRKIAELGQLQQSTPSVSQPRASGSESMAA